MHFLLILFILFVAYFLRLKCQINSDNWSMKWQKTLILFILPPLMIITTAIAIFGMGATGNMVGFWDGWVSYLLAGGFLITILIQLIKLYNQAQEIIQQIHTYPQKIIANRPVRILPTNNLISAIIGLWQSEIILSTALLKTLSPQHLEAVLVHEQAHYHYRDTFYFFWLGWLKNISFWLPNTHSLWQELLTLREIRADAKAAQTIDPLLLAEALLLISRFQPLQPPVNCAIGILSPGDRLPQRIEFLLSENPPIITLNQKLWLSLMPSLLPLLIIPFHK